MAMQKDVWLLLNFSFYHSSLDGVFIHISAINKGGINKQ